jgi:hypothetical protein
MAKNNKKKKVIKKKKSRKVKAPSSLLELIKKNPFVDIEEL